ncbi:hypothetical protein WJX79_004636 [Trebouxia sp. C0005]
MVSRLLPPGVHHDGLEPEMSASLDTRPIPTREMSGGDVGTPLGEVQKSTNRHSKRWVKEAFEHRPENAEKQATCRYCHKVRSTLNPTRQKEHLLNKKECQFLQSEDARMSTDPEVQSILAGGSLHPTPRRPKSDREPGASGGRVVPTAGRGLRREMNEIALKFLTSANRPELWAVFSGWVTELPADRVESEYDRLVMLHQSAIQDHAMQAAMLQYFETVCAKVGIGSVA